MKRIIKTMSVVTATAAAALVLGSAPASAATRVIVKTYPGTAAGARACQIDLKLAPANYFCTRIEATGRHALAYWK
ncbi:hypothetical protein DP939_29155 [Spongiactinospora rosea]|uniref:Uncharacterized protein n=1 Tax=Spongiactinospora rosea TaxID=2248750 RepID=A0A366LRZ8_9ACTN|nr:hypothetical protein [Spongiactinospora rosea]RBQ16745.1 hypothetical protein DP939_29155 [Spongiactinospora rosea]